MDFTAKRILVTAGANGIGLAIASKFRELGATVFVTDIDPDAVDKARVNGLLAAVSDVSDEGQVRALMDTVRVEMGGLDVLVNNAGIAGPTGPLEFLDAAAWKATFDVNIHGQFFCIKHALPLLREGSGASIVNLSSAAGRLGMAGRSAYSASKWAVVGLTKTLAIELGPDGIRVNAICPGAVNGPRIDAVIAAKARHARPAGGRGVRAVPQPVLAGPADRGRGHRQHGRLRGQRHGPQRQRPGSGRGRQHRKARLT